MSTNLCAVASDASCNQKDGGEVQKIALKIERQDQMCPVLFNIQNQVRYITVRNSVGIW